METKTKTYCYPIFWLGKYYSGLKNVVSLARISDFLLCAEVIYYEVASDQILVSQQDFSTMHIGRQSPRKKCRSLRNTS